MDNSEKSTVTSLPSSWGRHKWIPVFVIAAASTWWIRQSFYAEYKTILHVIVLFASVLALSIWFLLCGNGSWKRRCGILALVWLPLLIFRALYVPKYNGDMGIAGWRLRWAPAVDATLSEIKATKQASDLQATSHDYPRFLGNGYWAEVSGVELETDWKTHPPQEMWRREIGAGWSAFAVVGNYAVTLEQRGDRELVSCYRVETGEPVWTHSDEARFDPGTFAGNLGDIGPRATPTIHGDYVLSQGGTGIVNCLDARTGVVVWSHDTAKEFDSPVAMWGKSGSPLVVDDLAIISVGAPDASSPTVEAGTHEADQATSKPDDFSSSLVAFDLKTGDVRWSAGNRRASYASPVFATLAGERQILVVNQSYLTAHRANDGRVLWEFPFADENDTSASASQPIPLDGDRVFISKGYGVGACLLQVRRDSDDGFTSEPIWSPAIQPVMKTKFCNVVMHRGFVFGLDDVLLECMELDTAKVRWKKRRRPEFGHGQIMLIGDVILVLSETGELTLVEASPEKYHELATLQALKETDVTWNTPAFAPPFLIIRNAREAVCYKLPLIGESGSTEAVAQ